MEAAPKAEPLHGNSDRRLGRSNPFALDGPGFIEGLGGSSRVSCFVAGTTVLTEHGLIKVEELATGDCVVSWDDQVCSRTAYEISAVHRGYSTEFVHISVGAGTVTCTPEHPFWVDGREWVKARDLIVGDRLVDAEGVTIVILAIEHEFTCTPVPVYNVTVGGKHTFYVGESLLLVHNKLL